MADLEQRDLMVFKAVFSDIKAAGKSPSMW
jgi:hypothetical protein